MANFSMMFRHRCSAVPTYSAVQAIIQSPKYCINDLITFSVKAVGYTVNLLPAKPVSATVILCRSVKTHVFSHLNLERANQPESFRCCTDQAFKS